jgi:hypothetical protein
MRTEHALREKEKPAAFWPGFCRVAFMVLAMACALYATAPPAMAAARPSPSPIVHNNGAPSLLPGPQDRSVSFDLYRPQRDMHRARAGGAGGLISAEPGLSALHRFSRPIAEAVFQPLPARPHVFEARAPPAAV